jgi:hypothetical protein
VEERADVMCRPLKVCCLLILDIDRRFDMNRDIKPMLRDVSMCGPHSVQKCVFSKICRRNLEKGIKGGKILEQGFSACG